MKKIFIVLSFIIPVTTSLIAPPSWCQEAILYRTDYHYYRDMGSSFPKDSIPNMVTVDFQYHKGKTKLEDGRTLEGWFCFAPYGRAFDPAIAMQLKHKKVVFYKQDENGPIVETIPNEKVIRLAVSGKDSTVFTPGDSTLFLRKNNMLLRLLSIRPVPFYDNLLIVDELASRHFSFWRRLVYENGNNLGSYTVAQKFSKARAFPEWIDISTYRQLRTTAEIYYEWQGKLEKIKKWDDVKGKFNIDPYIQKIAGILFKKDAYDIGFGITFSISENKMELLPFFEKMEINLKNGHTLKGTGFIIPLRYGWQNEPVYITFYDGKNFSVLKPDEISSASYRNKIYTPAYNKGSNCWFMTYPWEHEGEKYQVAERLVNTNGNGFFDQEGSPYYLILSRKNNGNYHIEQSKKLMEYLVKEL